MHKSFVLALFSITLQIGPRAIASPLRCESVFQTETRSEESQTLKTNFDLAYQKSEQVQGIDGRTGTLRTFSHYHQTLEGQMIRTDLFDLLPSKTQAAGSSKYLELIDQNIDFVLSQYQQRRDWHPDYLAAIRSDAIAYAPRATYIVAIKQEGLALQGAGEIIGTMKVVAGDSKNLLPFEADHQIKVPLNGGKKFEPGNFVVLKDESAVAFGEVMSHFVRFAKELQKDPKHNTEQMIFFTDADRASAMMYRQLGFSTVPGFEAPLIKNGKEYYLIGASTNTVLKFPKVFEAKRSEWTKEGALETFTRIPGRMPLQDQAIHFKYLQIKTIYDDKYSAKDFQTLHQGGLQAYFARNRDGERHLTLRRDHGIGKFYFNIHLKESDLPLVDGFKSERRESAYYQLKTSYKNGILKIHLKETDQETKIFLETNSDFSDIRGLKIEKFSHGEKDLEITTLAAPDVHSFP